MVPRHGMGGWRYAWEESGELCVKRNLRTSMLRLPVDSWAFPPKVRTQQLTFSLLSLSLYHSLSHTHTHTLSLSYSHTLDASVVPGGTFGEGARMWIKDVECRGYEDKLYQCQSSSPGYFHGCRPHNSTGIWCAGQCMPLTSLSVSQHGLGQGVGTSNTVIQVMCCSD